MRRKPFHTPNVTPVARPAIFTAVNRPAYVRNAQFMATLTPAERHALRRSEPLR